MLQFALHTGETEARMAQRLAPGGSESRLHLRAVASMARSALKATGLEEGLCAFHPPRPDEAALPCEGGHVAAWGGR